MVFMKRGGQFSFSEFTEEGPADRHPTNMELDLEEHSTHSQTLL